VVGVGDDVPGVVDRHPSGELPVPHVVTKVLPAVNFWMRLLLVSAT
jgi:hypothetical protein